MKEKDEISVTDFAEALSNGSRLAYKAVMRPVEGTILTVIREACEAGTAFAEENPEADCQQFMNCVCEAAGASLQRTPELLPVLKEAHVVDSGGSGLLAVLEGFKAYIEKQLGTVEPELNREDLRDILLHIYSNPVLSKENLAV